MIAGPGMGRTASQCAQCAGASALSSTRYIPNCPNAVRAAAEARRTRVRRRCGWMLPCLRHLCARLRGVWHGIWPSVPGMSYPIEALQVGDTVSWSVEHPELPRVVDEAWPAHDVEHQDGAAPALCAATGPQPVAEQLFPSVQPDPVGPVSQDHRPSRSASPSDQPAPVGFTAFRIGKHLRCHRTASFNRFDYLPAVCVAQ